MFRVQSLGASQVCRPDGSPIHFRSRKHLALLVYLALTGPRLSRRERLVGLLWPDDDEARARHSLSQSLYALKRLLGEEVVEVRSEEVQIGAERWAVRVSARGAVGSRQWPYSSFFRSLFAHSRIALRHTANASLCPSA